MNNNKDNAYVEQHISQTASSRAIHKPKLYIGKAYLNPRFIRGGALRTNADIVSAYFSEAARYAMLTYIEENGLSEQELEATITLTKHQEEWEVEIAIQAQDAIQD